MEVFFLGLTDEALQSERFESCPDEEFGFIMPIGLVQACKKIRPDLDSVEVSKSFLTRSPWYSVKQGNKEWCAADPNVLLERLKSDEEADEIEEAA